MNGERFYHLDFMKMCLMFIVMASHSIEVANDDWFRLGIVNISALKCVSEWFSTFHVQGFTMVSGYLFFYLYVEQEKYSDIKRFIRNKFKRLLIPYVFVSCVWIIPINATLFHMGIKDVIHSFVFMENPSQLWFLIMLFGVFLIARYMAEYPQYHPVKTIVILGGGYFIGILGDRLFLNIFQIWTILQYLPFFYLGYYTRCLHSRYDIEKHWSLYLWVDILIFLIYKVYIQDQSGFIMFALYIVWGFLINVVGCLMVFACIGKIGKWVMSKWGGIFVLCGAEHGYLSCAQSI